jgi:hypothetical protein
MRKRSIYADSEYEGWNTAKNIITMGGFSILLLAALQRCKSIVLRCFIAPNDLSPPGTHTSCHEHRLKAVAVSALSPLMRAGMRAGRSFASSGY